MNRRTKNIKLDIPVYLLVLMFLPGTIFAGGRIISFGYSTALPEVNVDMKSVAAGYLHSLALTDSGRVVAWGDDRYGQSAVPSQCLTGIVAIAANGYHSLAVDMSGRVIAWGDNSQGQSAVPASALSNVRAVSAGLMHSLALLRSGRVIAWGDSMFGQTYVPAGLGRVVEVSAGALHSVALRNDGMVFIWGDNSFGQGVVPDRASVGIKAVAAGYFHNLALNTNGEVIAWGDNTFGQCNVPAAAKQDVVAISAGQDHSLALKADGSLVTWGGRSGQVPFAASVPNLTAISAGGYHSLGIVPEEADSNRNGIPDWWELQNNLDPSSPMYSAEDSDRDGVSNMDEFLTDTDPWDDQSYFRADITIDPVTGQMALECQPVSPNRHYTLEYATDTQKDLWRAVSGKTNMKLSSTDGPALLSIEDSKDFRIYRLRATE